MLAQELSDFDLAQEIFQLLLEHAELTETSNFLPSIPMYERIQGALCRNDKLTFILPAFPAKSPSPQKTSGILPDLGEVLALNKLDQLCDRITAIYPPGAQVLICSDGRVFSDVVRVPDEHIDLYSEGIDNIIEEFKLTNLATVSMDDFFPMLVGEELRALLLSKWAKSLDEVRTLVTHDQNYKRLFNGIHRFLSEDLLTLEPEKSRTQIQKETKLATYELLRRSDAWSQFLEENFPGTLRLSIHPYPIHHEKFGIKLLLTSKKWATPWHNVVVKVEDRFELMHMSEAIALKARKMLFKEKYVYFEV